MDAIELLIEAPGAAPAARQFDADSLVIGRTEKADVPVTDPSVSRRHARIFRGSDGWSIEDLGARNGTIVNGERITGTRVLRPGDRIRVGDTAVSVTAIGGASAPAPPVDHTARLGGDEILSVLKPASEFLRLGETEPGGGSRLHVLNEVHRALATPISRAELLQIVLDRAFAILNPEQGAVFLMEPGGELVRAAERRSLLSAEPLPVSTRLAHEVTVKGSAALVLDARIDERFAGAESIVASGVRSIVAAPLQDAQGCLGMIALYSRATARCFGEPDLELLVSLAWAAALRLRNLALAEEAAERRVVDRELALAREIQMGMLRRPSFEQAGVDVAARLVPARLVGGDLYEFRFDDPYLWFIVGDVAGKGMAAALMMVMAQTLFRAVATAGQTLAEMMERLNRELARDNERAMFVTALAGRLDIRTGRLELANAGHNLPYRVRPDGVIELVAATNSVALGVVDDVAFPITELELGPGEGLLLYTDGVTDAISPAGASFGVESLERHLRTFAHLDAEGIVGSLFAAIEAHAGGTAQEDDITIAVLKTR